LSHRNDKCVAVHNKRLKIPRKVHDIRTSCKVLEVDDGIFEHLLRIVATFFIFV